MRNNTVLLLDEGQAALVHSRPSSSGGADFTARAHAAAFRPAVHHPVQRRMVPRVFVPFEGADDAFWNVSTHTAEFIYAGLTGALLPTLFTTMSLEWHSALRAADDADDAAMRQRLAIDERARLRAQELEDEDV